MTEPAVDPQLRLVEHIYWLGHSLWSMAIRRGDGPEFERMYRPQVGDLVIERTSFAGFDPDGVGHLLRMEDDGDVFVIEPLLRPGEECRWANAEFFALPEDMKVMDWAKASEEKA